MQRAAGRRAEELGRRPRVLLDPGGRRLRDVLHVGELVVALGNACGAPEIVDRDGRVAALGETERELLVEAVQPPHVGEHDDPDAGRFVG